MASTFTLAHFSDPHLAPLPAAGLRTLLSKRILGYLSWKRRRQGIHQSPVLEALIRDLSAQTPDHVAVTGDLTNISLPAEFRRAASWLAGVGDPTRVSLVPGNHDAYVSMPWEQSLGHWRDYMSSDGDAAAPLNPSGFADFPYLRLRGPMAIIGLSSACATPPFFASGRLGAAQLQRLGRRLEGLAGQELFRVILLHHPPVSDGIKWRKRLVDAEALRGVVARAGAELLLHGHDHCFRRAQIETSAGTACSFGVPSASSAGDSRKPDAHYQLYALSRTAGGWHLRVRVRGLDSEAAEFTEREGFELEIAREGVTNS